MSGRPARAPRPLFPGAVTLRAAALLFEGDGRPALYLAAEDHHAHLHLYRVPTDAHLTVTLPHPLPTLDKKKRAFLPAGSRLTVEAGGARAVLEVHAVRLARELLEALEAYGEARQSAQAARQVFEDSGAA